jgi:hypothetical protein
MSCRVVLIGGVLLLVAAQVVVMQAGIGVLVCTMMTGT